MEINAALFVISVVLSVVWGFVWAYVLDHSEWWRWAVVKRTWLTVVIGVGANCAILFVVLPWYYAVVVLVVFASSSIGIINRSLNIERKEDI